MSCSDNARRLLTDCCRSAGGILVSDTNAVGPSNRSDVAGFSVAFNGAEGAESTSTEGDFACQPSGCVSGPAFSGFHDLLRRRRA